jgi:hypothetical protein
MSRSILFVALVIGAMGTAHSGELVIHEWGTITTIHDAAGVPATGINRIDASEVLPDFVHRYEPEATREDPRLSLGKSPRTAGRPDVTMRLETPVIYFYPPPNTKYDSPIDIRVRFRGGVLNEFYPRAEASVAVDQERINEKVATGIITPWNGAVLDNYVIGALQWKGLRLHDTVVAPLTNNPVWTAPREVHSASVFAADAGEGEHFVFYRGVAHLEALLQTRLSRGELRLSAPAQLNWLDAPDTTITNLWFADVRKDGMIAFRAHGAVALSKKAAGKEVAHLDRFADRDYQDAGGLRKALKSALINRGLYADEAEAMLNTWKASYFEKPGLRVFYIVPREWTDYFLPLEFSVPAQVTRVIVGRIDLK